jgi:hypothetical protein
MTAWTVEKMIWTSIDHYKKHLEDSSINHWKCGLDLNLEKWKTKLFNQRQYDAQEEK